MFSEIIRQLRKRAGLTQAQLANKLGLKQTTVSCWETGKATPTPEILLTLSHMFGISVDSLLGKDSENHPTESHGIMIPVLGDVRAGYPMEAMENIIDYEEIDEALARRGEYFALRIRGDSMEPKFSEGDVIIIRKQQTINSGEIAVVLVNGDSATVKIVKLHEHGLTLIPMNPAYHPMYYTNEEIHELPVTILGKVVELRAKF